MIIILITMILTFLIFYPILRMSSICSREEEKRDYLKEENKKNKESD